MTTPTILSAAQTSAGEATLFWVLGALAVIGALALQLLLIKIPLHV